MKSYKLFVVGYKLRNGVASLPTILILAVMIVAIGISIATLSFIDNIISQGSVQSEQARIYGETGAKDALVRIARNVNYSCTTTTSTGCYQIDMVTNGCTTNDGCVRVIVSTSTAPKLITAEGRVKNNIRTIQVSVTFDASSYGEIATSTWTEVTS